MQYLITHIITLSVNDNAIADVDRFIYLISIMSNDGDYSIDIKNGVVKAWGTFKKYTKMSKNINTNTKINIFKNNVMSVLLYCSETWKTTKHI